MPSHSVVLARAVPMVALCTLAGTSANAQARIVDEGTFAITRAGVSETESFRIGRAENGLMRATGKLVSGTMRVSSALTVDSLGTPVSYEVTVTDKGAKVIGVNAAGGGARLVATSNDQRGGESMREYPLSTGQSMILEDGLLHQLFFAPLGKRLGKVQIINPRASRVVGGTLTALGLEPVDIAGKSITGTHYSLVSSGDRRDFWTDASGRLLRVEIPSQQLVATREEPPR
jgi:hypothetical protein